MTENKNQDANLKFPFLDDLNLDHQAKNKLSIILGKTVEGNDDVFVSPLGNDNRDKVILEAWDSIFKSNSSDLPQSFIDIEESNRSKFGPRSIALPWSERRENLVSYFSKDIVLPNVESNIYPHTYKLRPISYENAADMMKLNTNSGLPYLMRKRLVKERTIDKHQSLLKAGYPCVLFTRTQEGNKTRDVWGYPMQDSINEQRFYKPLLDYQRSIPWRSCLQGPDATDISVSKLFDKLDGSNSVVCVDFSSFDSTVKGNLQRLAFDYIISLFQYKYRSEILDIFNRFNTIGIVTPDGIMSGPHGVPSGSTLTNEVDSIAQYIAGITSGFVSDDDFQIQGDDGIYIINDEHIDPFLNHLKSFGLNINESKSSVSKEYGTFLQRYYNINLRNKNNIIPGIYSTYRAINRMIFQERWSDFENYEITGKDYYSIRNISILENCKHHPMFKDLVRLIVGFDKYSLEYSQDGLKKFVDMMAKTKGIEGIIVNQYSDDVRGLKSFETVKIIKELL